jgi:hypothetical protein
VYKYDQPIEIAVPEGPASGAGGARS